MAYVETARNRSDLDRQKGADKDKTGVFTGAFAVNPVNGEKVPVWVADYVLASYGTGDDHGGARPRRARPRVRHQVDLPIIEVVQARRVTTSSEAYTGPGVAVNSGDFDGQATEAVKAGVIAALEAQGAGRKQVNYKLPRLALQPSALLGRALPVVHTEGGEWWRCRPTTCPSSSPHRRVQAHRDGRAAAGPGA